jgi:esterase/lipase
MLVILLVGAISLGGCSLPKFAPQPPLDRFETVDDPIDFTRFESFDEYLDSIRHHIYKYKVPYDPDRIDAERWLSMPFQHDGQCSSGKTSERGILLLHGLSDMPFAMRDLARVFAAQCFMVRSILLPGHGTRVSELVQIHREDWSAAVTFALNDLSSEVENVYVAGFSLGALLAIQSAQQDTSTRPAGIIALSPPLRTRQHSLLWHARWIRRVLTWADTDPQDDPARYEAMPWNALAETDLLAVEVSNQLKASSIAVPVFILQSRDDPVIDVSYNQQIFLTSITHPLSRFLEYRDLTAAPVAMDVEARTSYVDSYLPTLQIHSFSHLALHISPENSHYGRDGAYRHCGENTFGRPGAAVLACKSAVNPWMGEIYAPEYRQKPNVDQDSMARLTYNPLFDDMAREMIEFITEIEEFQTSEN